MAFPAPAAPRPTASSPRRGRGFLSRTAGLLTAVLAIGAPTPAAAAPLHGLGPLGTASIHGDIYSSDTIPGRGPGTGPGADHAVRSSLPGATCSSVFQGSDGMVTALCTSYLGFDPADPLAGFTPLAPTVVLFHPQTAQPLASLQLPKGSLLGGVYGYLDNDNRVVVADGNRAVHAVSYAQGPDGRWAMHDHILADLSDIVPAEDSLAGLLPDDAGRIWFATRQARVGTVLPDTPGTARMLDLTQFGEPGEQITNGLTLRPGGASITTTHALYELTVSGDGSPGLRWRHGYDRGPARHPGMLAWGSGSTPTYFPLGSRLQVAILDSGNRSDLLVYDADSGALTCRMPAFATTLDPSSAAADGVLISGPAQSENSLVAMPRLDGNGVGLIIPNTFGFQYLPAATDGPSVPEFAPYTGGITRIDVTSTGCSRAWTNPTRTATLPQATLADRLVHSLAYGPLPQVDAGSAQAPVDQAIAGTAAGLPQKFGPVYYSAIDAETGLERAGSFVGVAPLDEPMELTGTVAPIDGSAAGERDVAGAFWQPSIGRMLRIGPAL